MDVKPGAHVLCRWKDGKYYNAEVLQERSDPSRQFYVHYADFNKRLDCWVEADQVDLSAVQQPDEGNGMLTRRNKRRREETQQGDQREDLSNPQLAQFEKEHEENTKIRNIDRVVLGHYEIQTWYYSPYLTKFNHIPTLYICQFCLKYMRFGKTYREHISKCQIRRPPGKLVYRDQVSYGKVKSISVWEVQGSEHKLYCQNMCLLAKLFLDHKTLYYLVAPFKFYVLTEDIGKASHIVGYFSKEIGNCEYNLACILVLPPHQQKGFGRLLIALSYELSKREKRIGTPERPLSDMGRVSYRSYWTDTILELLRRRSNLNFKDITDETGIAKHDVMETLTSLGLAKYWKGQYLMNPVDHKMIEEHFRKKEQRKKKQAIKPVKFKSQKLK